MRGTKKPGAKKGALTAVEHFQGEDGGDVTLRIADMSSTHGSGSET